MDHRTKVQKPTAVSLPWELQPMVIKFIPHRFFVYLHDKPCVFKQAENVHTASIIHKEKISDISSYSIVSQHRHTEERSAN